MAYFLEVQAVLPYTTNLPRDVAVNTFHFRCDDVIDETTTLNLVNTQLQAFYNTTPTGGATDVANYISAVVSRAANACTFKMFRLSDPLPRAPRRVQSWTLDAVPNSASLPLEVALCGSYRAAYDSGTNSASRRGRVYIGPLQVNASSTVANQPPVPLTAFITTLNAAMKDLEAAGNATAQWIQFSRKLSAGNDIVGGWVDNEFDTQRRRQEKATARTNWVV